MSTDYRIVCCTCRSESPTLASASGFYGFKLWDIDPELREWFGHGQAVGHHEGHDLRILSEHADAPWEAEQYRHSQPANSELKENDPQLKPVNRSTLADAGGSDPDAEAGPRKRRE